MMRLNGSGSASGSLIKSDQQPPDPPPLKSFWQKMAIMRYIKALTEKIRAWLHHTRKMPIVVFYRYMWLNNKPLLFRTLFFNYVFQFILEILPWWASRRKVGNKLRTSRIKLNHNMVTGKDFKWKLMRDFIVKTVLFSILESLNRYVKNRVALENKFEIRRLVLERVLFAEISELDKLTSSYKGNLEDRVASDITSTLDFINKYLPSLVSGVYAFVVEGSGLLQKRATIHPLAIAYPVAITVIQKLISWAQHKYFLKGQKKASKDHQERLDMAMSVALSGIIDIQSNNLQNHQLAAFDTTTQEEVRNKEGFATYFFTSLSTLTKMSAFNYLIEVWSVHRIMKAGNLDHKQYSKIQQEIDHVITIGRRAITLLRKTKNIFKIRSKVVKLLDISTFINEAAKFKPLDPYDTFRELVIDNIKFNYHDHLEDLILDMSGTKLTFLPNKKYAILGQNRAGKSTLTKLITKLYAPNDGEIYWNGIPYSQIPRVALRDLITYIPQNPLIVGGTIRENILLGNPYATEQQILYAAEASGILDFMGVGPIGPNYGGGLRSVRSFNNLKAMPSTKKAKKKNKKSKKDDSDSDSDDGGGMNRTLSFAEIGDIARPRYEGKGKSSASDDSGSVGDENGDGVTDDGSSASADSDSSSSSDSDDDEVASVDSNSSTGSSGPQDGLFSTLLGYIPGIRTLASSADELGDKHTPQPFTKLAQTLPSSISAPDFSQLAEAKLYGGSSHKRGSSSSSQLLSKSVSEIHSSSSSNNLNKLGLGRNRRSYRAEQLKVLDHVLAPGGGDMGGGFAQSVALARVFVRPSARVVILDEATSHMDTVKLRDTVFPKLLTFVEQQQMCLIVITHHFYSIKDFDHLVVMHNGSVAHQGTHEELVSEGAELYLQLNPVSNSLKSYHSRLDLASLCEEEDEFD